MRRKNIEQPQAQIAVDIIDVFRMLRIQCLYKQIRNIIGAYGLIFYVIYDISEPFGIIAV